MKPLLAGRLVWVLISLGTLAVAKWLTRVLPADMAGPVAQLLTDEVLAVVVPLLAGVGIALKSEDRKKVDMLLLKAKGARK